MHQKRSEMPAEWPLPRKGNAYIAVASHSKYNGITLLFIIRDVLKIARTRKEAEYILRNGDVKVNSIVRKDENFPVQAFETISLDRIKKHYSLAIVSGKYQLKEISEKETEKKVVKIMGKKMKGKNVQMNLEDGQNFLFKENFAIGDSAVINNKTRKVEKILALKPGSAVEISSGKYAGQKGKVKEIEVHEREKMFIIKFADKEAKLPLKTFFVIE
jgi:small subunit ribosomal protein S4e